MAAPTKTEVLTGEYFYMSGPAVSVGGKTAVNPSTLEYTNYGYPVFGITDSSPAGLIKKVKSATWAAIKKIGGIILANIKKIGTQGT